MLLIRNAGPGDVDDLYELSCLENLINLPQSRPRLAQMIQETVRSFQQADKDKSKNCYIFVLEDLTEGKVVGVSMIYGRHGTEEKPHFFFRVSREETFSSTINQGFIQGTLELDYEPNGYSEVGGLVLHPDYRGRPEKLGKQLSFCRFFYMAFNRELFTPIIHAELLPPFDRDGRPPLWEAIGRKFTNMSYGEADRLSRVNKEFIINLFPLGKKIYTALLPVEAQNAIGQVGSRSQLAQRMLEQIGLRYVGEVDPFDGGPHYRCKRNEIVPFRDARRVTIVYSDTVGGDVQRWHLVGVSRESSAFCCVGMRGKIDNSGKALYLARSEAELYDIADGLETICTPI